MPTFTINIPGDDRTFTIEGPEGATQEDAMRQLREKLIAERPKESGLQDFAEGVGLSGIETYTGIKDLFGAATPKDAARLEDWRQDAGQSGYGTAGEVVGNIGQYMVPGGTALKGLKLASKASKLAKATQATRGSRALTRALADTAGAGAVGYVKAPDIGESRGTNASGDVAGAITGEALGFGLGKAIRGINKTPEAERLLDLGVPLTPGEAASSKMVQGLEAVGEVSPLVAHGVKRARAASEEGLQKLVLNQSLAPGGTVTETGTKGIEQLKQGFSNAYSDAWSGADKLSNQARIGFINTAVNGSKSLTKKQRNALKGVMGDFRDLTANVTPDKFKAMDNDLRKRIAAAKKDYDYQQLLTTMRNTLRSGAPPKVTEKLAATDAQYGKYLVARRAAKNALSDSGNFGGKHLINAVKAIGKDMAGEGSAPLQQIAMDAGATTERSLGGQPLEWFRRVAGITPTPFPMQAAGRVVLGRTKAQMAAQKATDKVPELLRRPGALGAATDADTQEFWKYWK
jgi:hypothetical protein